MLTAITAGFRDLLLARGDGDDGAEVRALVPTSVRATGDHRPNNQMIPMFVGLPVGIAEPVERLTAARERLDAVKASHEADTREVLVELAGVGSSGAVRAGAASASLAMRRLPSTASTP